MHGADPNIGWLCWNNIRLSPKKIFAKKPKGLTIQCVFTIRNKI